MFAKYFQPSRIVSTIDIYLGDFKSLADSISSSRRIWYSHYIIWSFVTLINLYNKPNKAVFRHLSTFCRM